MMPPDQSIGILERDVATVLRQLETLRKSTEAGLHRSGDMVENGAAGGKMDEQTAPEMPSSSTGVPPRLSARRGAVRSPL
jgi:hypothetical protein